MGRIIKAWPLGAKPRAVKSVAMLQVKQELLAALAQALEVNRELATRDELTGLINRRAMLKGMGVAVAAGAANPAGAAEEEFEIMKRHVVDGGEFAETLGEVLEFDHAEGFGLLVLIVVTSSLGAGL